MTASRTINVMATAAFKEAYLELVPQFERASGHQVISTWTNTLEIVRRVKAGEATDLAHTIIRAKGMEPA